MTERLAPVILVLVIIAGGVFEIVGFHLLFKALIILVTIVFVVLPPVGALIYLISRFRA